MANGTKLYKIQIRIIIMKIVLFAIVEDLMVKWLSVRFW